MKRIKSIPLGQFFMGLFWLMVALLTFWGISPLHAAEPGGLGPASFPKILAFSLVGLVSIYWLQSRKDEPISFSIIESGGSIRKAVLLVVLAYTSALLWEPVGALPILVAYSVIEIKWIEGFGWIKVVTVGLPLAIGFWLVFTQGLGVALPLGLLIWFY